MWERANKSDMLNTVGHYLPSVFPGAIISFSNRTNHARRQLLRKLIEETPPCGSGEEFRNCTSHYLNALFFAFKDVSVPSPGYGGMRDCRTS